MSTVWYSWPMTHTTPAAADEAKSYDRQLLDAAERLHVAEVDRITELMATSCKHCGNGPATVDGSPCDHCCVELSTIDLCERAGVSYRRVDYWARNGYITPMIDADGSGSRRVWRASDVARLRRIVRFSDLTGLRQDGCVRLLWRLDPSRPAWLARRHGVMLAYDNRPNVSIPAIWLPAEVD